jgi:hypothetical protein
MQIKESSPGPGVWSCMDTEAKKKWLEDELEGLLSLDFPKTSASVAIVTGLYILSESDTGFIEGMVQNIDQEATEKLKSLAVYHRLVS